MKKKFVIVNSRNKIEFPGYYKIVTDDGLFYGHLHAYLLHGELIILECNEYGKYYG